MEGKNLNNGQGLSKKWQMTSVFLICLRNSFEMRPNVGFDELIECPECQRREFVLCSVGDRRRFLNRGQYVQCDAIGILYFDCMLFIIGFYPQHLVRCLTHYI